MKYLLLSLMFGFAFISCDKDDDDMDTCDTSNVTYTNTVASIFNQSCATAGCHVDGNEANAGGFSLEGYEKASFASGFGRMEGALNHAADHSPMPKNGDKLDQCDIDKITAWIADGSPE